MKLNITVTGGKEVGEILRKKVRQINKELTKKLMKCVLVVEADAKKNCPVDTGRLRSSITSEVKEHTGKVGTNVKYAPYIEFGTDKMRPQPYLYPALQKNFNFIRKTLGKAVVEPLRRR